MQEIALLMAAQAVLLGAVVVLREPKLLIPCVVLGLPIEVFEALVLGSGGGAMGAIGSLLNPGQAAMIATVLVVVVRERHTPWRLLPNSGMVLPITVLFLVMWLGVAWSDNPLRPNNSVLILPLYLAFAFCAPRLIEDRRDVERIVGAFLLGAALLAMLALGQRVLGIFTWRSNLFSGGVYRSNATFSDPNLLARYLGISMALAAGLMLATGPRRQTVYLAIPAFVFGSAAILATGSRSGWVMLLLTGFVVVMASPVARYTKGRLTVAAFVGLGLGFALLLAQGGAEAERVKSLADGLGVLGQRQHLIRVGWEMWKDSPLVGWGAGNWQHTLTTNYLQYIPSWSRTTLSHTALVTILAELGIVGVAAFLFVCVRIAVTIVRSYFATDRVYSRLMLGWLGAALLGVLFSSQSEGRLWDDPFLWVYFALVIAFETAPGLAGRAAPRAILEPASPPVARPAPAGGAVPVPASPMPAE